jgi:hypothetical protein
MNELHGNCKGLFFCGFAPQFFWNELLKYRDYNENVTVNIQLP